MDWFPDDASLKRWLLGTHQGSVQPQLDASLDEFTFRFNRRSSRSRGLLFYRLLEQAVATDPLTYRAIAAKGAQTQDLERGGARWIALMHDQYAREALAYGDPRRGTRRSTVVTAVSSEAGRRGL